MAKNVLQSTILSGAGAVAIAPGAQIEVRSPSGLLVPLWLDRDGTQPTTNPTTADADGFFRVYLNSGRYHITARSGGESREWRDVLLGSAAGYDVDDMLAALAAGVYTSVAEGLAATAEGDFFWVAHQASEDVLTLYRVVDGDAELWAALPRGEVVRELTDRAEDAAESAEEDAQAAQDALDAILALGDLPAAVAAAEGAASIATAKAGEAAGSATTAAGHAATAQEWATKTNGPVEGDEYSAKRYALDAAEDANRAEAAADDLELARVPLFFVAWCPDRNHIWPGYVAADGQQLSSATYPDASAGITAGAVPTTDDATWLADPSQRGKYVADDGSGLFRVPDLNGKYSGSFGAVFLRGDGAMSAGSVGVIQRDAFQGFGFATHPTGGGTGTVASLTDRGNIGFGGLSNAADPGVTYTNSLRDGAHPAIGDDGVNGEPRTASETRPLNVTGCWVIRLFGAVANPGSADAAQLASDYANINAAFQALDSDIDFTIIYPNGGSAASPANITINSRYVEANPFPGYPVICQAEIFVGGEWCGIGFSAYSTSTSAGVEAAQHADGGVVIQTGINFLVTNTKLSFFTGATRSNVTDAPCRVKVWKVKGAMA